MAKTYTLTFAQARKYWNKSSRILTRHVKKVKLHPERITSKQGILKYRFKV